MKRPLAITLGDPAGVGPEVILKALAHPRLRRTSSLVIGDVTTMRETSRRLRLGCDIVAVTEVDVVGRRLPPSTAGALRIVPVLAARRLGDAARRPGRPSVAGGRASYRYIETAARLAMAEAVSGIVTAPINKAWVTRAGFPITGHTELLAAPHGRP